MNPSLDPKSFAALCEFSIQHLVLPHDAIRLYAGLSSKEPFLIPAEVMREKKEVDRFLAVLSILHKKKKRKFEEIAPTLKGTKRKYFAQSAAEIYSTGSSNIPSLIPGTTWYVSTNSWGPRKAAILTQLMVGMGFSDEYADFVSDICQAKAPRLPWNYRKKLEQNEKSEQGG